MEEPKHDTRRGNQSARIAAIVIWLKLFWTPNLGTSTGQIPTAVETAGGGGRIVVCQAAFSQCDETSVATFEAVSR